MTYEQRMLWKKKCDNGEWTRVSLIDDEPDYKYWNRDPRNPTAPMLEVAYLDYSHGVSIANAYYINYTGGPEGYFVFAIPDGWRIDQVMCWRKIPEGGEC